ncbi:hypothetical protein QFC22_002768 [Naganishia vaughanmartiniae]|uniref:Uncharacterized protein n=1 Tax=Naganishia vaughanmartiniae TaxID=1424756 RepID=A0ACC2X9X8_9TREE|nr:hypothetical protein QFC22_002768 [Naganishia vaughanmartiniae]
MPQEFVNPETFLQRLTQCFESATTKGSVNLTHKRYTFGPSTSVDEDGDDAMEGDSVEDKEYDVLIRCTDGMEINFATRASMAPKMRKRDKKKEKAKAELLAKKRKELYEDVTPGGRRTQQAAAGGVASAEATGTKHKLGHRQRAAQNKKMAERERLEEREAAMKNSTAVL